MDHSPQGCSVHGILRQDTGVGVISSSGGLPDSAIRPTFLMSPALQVCFLPLAPLGKDDFSCILNLNLLKLLKKKKLGHLSPLSSARYLFPGECQVLINLNLGF